MISPQPSWMLDSSTFINFAVIEAVPLLLRLRSPLSFAEYVFRVELGLNAKQPTRERARAAVTTGGISIQQLTVDDLDRVARLSAPRRVGLGEIACAIIAERLKAGVLCDDRKARPWLSERVAIPVWEDTEEILLAAALRFEVTEYELIDYQERLATGRYQCRLDLRLEFLQRRLNQGLP